MKRKKICKHRSGGKNQTLLKNPGRNVGGEKQYINNQAEKNTKIQRSKSALKISTLNNVGGEQQKEHDQS